MIATNVITSCSNFVFLRQCCSWLSLYCPSVAKSENALQKTILPFVQTNSARPCMNTLTNFNISWNMRIRIPIIPNVPMQLEINSAEKRRWSDLTPYLNGILSHAIPINDQSPNYVNQRMVTNSEKLKLLAYIQQQCHIAASTNWPLLFI